MRRRLTPEKKYVLRDAIIFAIKLWADGIKDFVFGFGVIGAAVLDLIRKQQPGGFLFYRVVKLGQRLDKIIDPYGGYEPPPEKLRHPGEPFDHNIG